ncbi:MAG: hypothetical protein IID44_04765 [Planctomycetes bacterium]|nr:hypothetical protein [Planctomycetota bacterium]
MLGGAASRRPTGLGTALDENNLPADLRNGWEFLISGGVPSGDDITGNDDLTITLSV